MRNGQSAKARAGGHHVFTAATSVAGTGRGAARPRERLKNQSPDYRSPLSLMSSDRNQVAMLITMEPISAEPKSRMWNPYPNSPAR